MQKSNKLFGFLVDDPLKFDVTFVVGQLFHFRPYVICRSLFVSSYQIHLPLVCATINPIRAHFGRATSGSRINYDKEKGEAKRGQVNIV